ncbi:MAG: hypothetical protein ABIP74_02220 [Candidatus Saccharimonas sp.]
MGLLRKKQSQPARRRLGQSDASQDGAQLNERYAFRRNRTLTGSLASHVESAGEANSELRSSRVQKHDLHAHRKRLGLYLFLSICGAILLAWCIYQSIAIVDVRADTKVVIDQRLYSGKIQDYLTGHPFERLRASVDISSLTTYLQRNGCPEVASVASKVTYDGFGASGFTITFRKPVVLWKTGATKLYVDGEGNAFARNFYDDPGVEVVDQTGIQAQDDQVLASERFISTIGRVIGRMSTQGYKVNRVVLPANTTRQLLISAEGISYPIKFSIDRSAGEQAEDADRAIKYVQSKGLSPEYVDVRVSGRAFYK